MNDPIARGHHSPEAAREWLLGGKIGKHESSGRLSWGEQGGGAVAGVEGGPRFDHVVSVMFENWYFDNLTLAGCGGWCSAAAWP